MSRVRWLVRKSSKVPRSRQNYWFRHSWLSWNWPYSKCGCVYYAKLGTKELVKLHWEGGLYCDLLSIIVSYTHITISIYRWVYLRTPGRSSFISETSTYLVFLPYIGSKTYKMSIMLDMCKSIIKSKFSKEIQHIHILISKYQPIFINLLFCLFFPNLLQWNWWQIYFHQICTSFA